MERTFSKPEDNIFFCKSLVEIILSNQQICEMIKTILKDNTECMNKPYREYTKPILHYAAENGNSLLVEKLLVYGATCLLLFILPVLQELLRQ